jgi:hypothetical protein
MYYAFDGLSGFAVGLCRTASMHGPSDDTGVHDGMPSVQRARHSNFGLRTQENIFT